jgi:hypothetical protein
MSEDTSQEMNTAIRAGRRPKPNEEPTPPPEGEAEDMNQRIRRAAGHEKEQQS